MTTFNIALSTDAIPKMLKASQQQLGGQWQINKDELCWDIEQPFGLWQNRCIPVRDGIYLGFIRAELRQDVSFVEELDQLSNWAIRFCLSGQSVQRLEGENLEIVGRPGMNMIGFASGKIQAKTTYAANQVVEILNVGIAPEQFKALLPPELAEMDFGQTIARDRPDSKLLVTVNQTTPAMLTVLQQIMTCPHEGQLKLLYMESKALELIVMKLAQVQESASIPQFKYQIKADDIERLHRAREILIQNLAHPPSLKALAQQTEMNDFKLKRGFRQMFGTTVFGYLHQCRMEKAQMILERGNYSVAQVAQKVGYASPSQFSAAFKRRFGVTPRSYKGYCG
ncbi:MAG: AraC family transcriptional regulator [Cyanobacteria bacterium P01_C01_bin.89]|mgnify:FL=1